MRSVSPAPFLRRFGARGNGRIVPGLPTICFLIAAATAAACADSQPASTSSCDRLAEHLVSLRVSESLGDTHETPRIAERHRTNLRRAAGLAYAEQCSQSYSSEYVTCVLGATTLEAAEGCDAGGF